jgi:hypothetical protein
MRAMRFFSVMKQKKTQKRLFYSPEKQSHTQRISSFFADVQTAVQNNIKNILLVCLACVLWSHQK